MLSVKILSYGPLNSATHIFTRLERLLTISDRGQIAGVCCSNKIKNHHFVICRGYEAFMITRNRYVFRNQQISKKVDAKNYLIFKYVVENIRLKKIIPNLYGQTNFFFRDRAPRRDLNF